MKTWSKLAQNLHKQGDKQSHWGFSRHDFQKISSVFSGLILGLITEVRNTRTEFVSMTKLVSQINKQ